MTRRCSSRSAWSDTRTHSKKMPTNNSDKISGKAQSTRDKASRLGETKKSGRWGAVE
ncbi:MAG: hypothetical protein ABIO88_11835 [Burkholderiaceae bacterium]